MKRTVAVALAMIPMSTFAQLYGETPIVGTVESKCFIVTDTEGVYGNATPSNLSTDPADGGVKPIIRFDIIQADAYKAVISHPISFSQSPVLADTVTWTGSTSVGEVSDELMSDYDTNKVTYDNKTEYEMSVAGSTWFTVASEADYGYNKAFPAGTYRAIVEAECIAQ